MGSLLKAPPSSEAKASVSCQLAAHWLASHRCRFDAELRR